MQAPLVAVATFALACLVAVPSVHADSSSIAVLPIAVRGEAPEVLLNTLQASLVNTLRTASKVASVEDTKVALASEKDLAGCFSTDCLARIGDLLSVSRFVRPELTIRGASYELRLQLLDIGANDRLQNTVTIDCAVCTISDLTAKSSKAAERLLRAPRAKRTKPAPSARPTPAATEPEPAPMAGNTQAATKTTQSGTPRALAWGAVGAAAAFLALGTTLIIIDDTGACDSPTAQCKYHYSTMSGGVFSIAAGLASGVAAGWLFGRNSNAQSTLSIVNGGAMGGLAFHF